MLNLNLIYNLNFFIKKTLKILAISFFVLLNKNLISTVAKRGPSPLTSPSLF